jgi:hypothetical protein
MVFRRAAWGCIFPRCCFLAKYNQTLYFSTKRSIQGCYGCYAVSLLRKKRYCGKIRYTRYLNHPTASLWKVRSRSRDLVLSKTIGVYIDVLETTGLWTWHCATFLSRDIIFAQVDSKSLKALFISLLLRKWQALPYMAALSLLFFWKLYDYHYLWICAETRRERFPKHDGCEIMEQKPDRTGDALKIFENHGDLVHVRKIKLNSI